MEFGQKKQIIIICTLYICWQKKIYENHKQKSLASLPNKIQKAKNNSILIYNQNTIRIYNFIRRFCLELQ